MTSRITLLAQVAFGCFVFVLLLIFSGSDDGLENVAAGSRRSLQQQDHKDASDDPNYKGSIVVDFYRTKTTRQFLGALISYTDYSIPKWRLWWQLNDLNQWFEGRVSFQMGDMYDTEDPTFLETPFQCRDVIGSFSNSPELRNPESRISVLYVDQVEGTGHGCATYNTLYGGTIDNNEFAAPAMILGMSNTRPLWLSSTLGAGHWGGCSIAYHMGLILGLLPTAAPQEDVAVYQDETCALDYRYPQFDYTIGGLTDGQVDDPVTGETYRCQDWRGRYNIMNPLEGSRDFYRIPTPFKLGLFQKRYGPIFDNILACWFTRAAGSEQASFNNTQT